MIDDERDNSDEDKQEAKRKKSTVEQLDASYRAMLADKDGRAVLSDILSRLGLHASPVGGNEYQTALLLGPHVKAMELRDMLRALSRENFTLLEKENLP